MKPTEYLCVKSGVCVIGLLSFLHVMAFGQVPYGTLKTVHFNVQYQRGVTEEEARTAADYLQTDYGYLSEKLGMDLKKKLDVRIYESVQKFTTQANRTRPWRGALYWHGVLHVQPVRALAQRKILEQSLSFELVEAMLEPSAAKGCPRWLCEAFAVYHSGLMAKLTRPVGVRLSSFADLEQDIQSYQNPPQWEDVRYVLGVTMKYLVDTYGEEKVLGLFKAFDGEKSVQNVFKNGLGQDFAAVEKAWAKHLAATGAPSK
jgi:hypothetical protein